MTHYKECATIRNLKPEWWDSPLFQEEKYQEKPVKREKEIIITTLCDMFKIANKKKLWSKCDPIV
jgi:hypothetical protein